MQRNQTPADIYYQQNLHPELKLYLESWLVKKLEAEDMLVESTHTDPSVVEDWNTYALKVKTHTQKHLPKFGTYTRLWNQTHLFLFIYDTHKFMSMTYDWDTCTFTKETSAVLYALQEMGIAPYFHQFMCHKLARIRNRFWKDSKEHVFWRLVKHVLDQCEGRKVDVTIDLVRQCTTCDKKLEDWKSCPCKAVAYCGRSCQKKHWKVHKKTCLYFKQKQASQI